ncbi:4'-phosphopantetheinyl transferase family protein [Desulfonema magnum]|uniref:4'-phosphopantetheinyl transferase domain-containing protein n=1 Tax=Desulfonema magnum TaxID=45655 RepID=A0A975BT12_9BACT|nr:4'-phosphopantetheinyl transferase superfamily protein [Desulfonema magnum]QTA91115.1 4'-phosphopantetheinyl transferase domain-containing protein [Desulfonema magnum]
MIQPNETKTIYPVILTVPLKDRDLRGRSKVSSLSRHARHALKISAEKSGYELKQTNDLLKDEHGAPLPVDGKYWSVTHKPEYVGGVIASGRIGIDIEKIRPCSALLFKRIADDSEWGLTDAESFKLFFRYWTSKEAVLKASGTGIKGLPKCKVTQITDDHHLIIEYSDKKWLIEHFYFDGHIASVVKNIYDINQMLSETGSVEWKLI